MSPDQRFALIISLLSLVFVVMSTILAFVVKTAMTWGRSSQQLKTMVDDLGEIKDQFKDEISKVIANKEREHSEIKERLTYLERKELNERRRGVR